MQRLYNKAACEIIIEEVTLLPSRKARQLIVMRCRFAFVYMYVCMHIRHSQFGTLRLRNCH